LKIKPYNAIDFLQELGENAELFLDGLSWDVSNMNFREMLTLMGPEIEKAVEIVLQSEEAGNWKYQKDRKRWVYWKEA